MRTKASQEELDRIVGFFNQIDIPVGKIEYSDLPERTLQITFKAGVPVTMEKIRIIADKLGNYE